jgi:hypothetical protein
MQRPKAERLSMRIMCTVAMMILLLIAGCSKLTMDNYNKLKAGMTYNEVVNIIGSPDKCSDVLGMRNCVWGDEKKSATVTFAGDRVLFFSANNIR